MDRMKEGQARRKIAEHRDVVAGDFHLFDPDVVGQRNLAQQGAQTGGDGSLENRPTVLTAPDQVVLAVVAGGTGSRRRRADFGADSWE